jgi:osmotically-inducible protein OsmY
VQKQPDSRASWSDREIQRVVEQQLQRRERVPAHAVDVAVSDGKVTLSGAVSSLAAKWHASEIAAGIRAVVDVQNRLQVSSKVKVPDEILAARVKAALSEEVAADLPELRVEVNNAIVTVRGETQSFQERLAIDEIVSRVAGVRGLRNLASVSTSSEQRPDRELQADIVSRLAWNESLDSNNIKVEVHDSVARLGGTVASASAKRQAVENAWVTGVNRVDSSLLKVAPVNEETQQDVAARKSNAPARGAAAQAQRGSATEVNKHPPLADLVIQRFQSDHKLADDKLTVEINQRLATITGMPQSPALILAYRRDALRMNSSNSPATSTPVKFPPTTTKRKSARRSSVSSVALARSNISIARSRRATASASDFISIACSRKPGIGGIFDRLPSARTR